jgi:hypothetical protein
MLASEYELYGVAPFRERVGQLGRVVEQAPVGQWFDNGNAHGKRCDFFSLSARPR